MIHKIVIKLIVYLQHGVLMAIKSNKELIEEFLKTNSITVLPPVIPKDKRCISSVKKGIADIVSLGEAIDLYGERSSSKTKKKVPNFSNINKDLIPSSLHDIFNKLKSKEDTKDETKCN